MSRDLLGSKLRVQSRIRLFDIYALLDVLGEMGYRQGDVYFESNANWASSKSLCESIHFGEEFPRVRVVVNMGLLAANSPLPTYFVKKMDDGSVDAEAFKRFVGFFDHHIVMQLMMMSAPERGGIHFDWNQSQEHYLNLLLPSSPSTMWCFFSWVFPELEVELFKKPKLISLRGSSAVLGSAKLGRGIALGQSKKKKVPSYCVHLRVGSLYTENGSTWPSEVKKRLHEDVLMLFCRTDVHFSIILFIEDCEELIHLADCPLLGYTTLGKRNGDLDVRIYNGYPRELRFF